MTFRAVLGTVVPTIEVAVDLDNDPTAGTTTWTDITRYVVSYSRQPVRNNEFDQPNTSTGSLVLRNDDARFIPDNAAGPYYGKLKKLRRVRVRAQWAGVTYNRFFGYVEDWPQTWAQAGRDQHLTVTMKDNFTPLETYDLAGQSFASASSGTAIRSVLAAAGVTAVNLDGGQSTVAASGTLSSTFALQRIHDIAASENGVCYPDGGGTVVFHDRRHRLTGSGTVVAATIGDAAGEIPYVDADPAYGDVWPIVRVTAFGGTAEVATNTAGTASYFQRTLNFPPSGSYQVASQSEAKAAAQYLAARYSDPSTRVRSVTLLGGRAPNLWGNILGLDTSSLVLFRRRFLSSGTVAGTVSFQGFVEGYGEQVTVGQDWRVQMPLSPADMQQYWLAGVPGYSEAGTTTVAGY